MCSIADCAVRTAGFCALCSTYSILTCTCSDANRITLAVPCCRAGDADMQADREFIKHRTLKLTAKRVDKPRSGAPLQPLQAAR